MKDRAGAVRKKSRFVVELRFAPAAQFLDRRGDAIAYIHPKIASSLKHWQLADDHVLFSEDLRSPTIQFAVGLKKIQVIQEDAATLQAFLDSAEKYLRLAYDATKDYIPKIDRVGVRFMSVCKGSDANYGAVLKTVLDRFHKLPLSLPIDITDSQAIVVHKYGRYAVGPTRKGDDWIAQTFQRKEENVPDFGYALDVDSFAGEVRPKNVDALLVAVRNVIELTRTVEEAMLVAAGLLDE